MLTSNNEFARRPVRRTARALACASLMLVLLWSAGASAAASAGTPPETASDVVDAACPCSGPTSGGSWRNHGQYVACVTKVARRQAQAEHSPPGTARRIVRDRQASSCGVSKPGDGNVHVCATNPVLACPVVRTARVDDCGECAAALAGELVHCARVETAGGLQSDVCGASAAGVRPVAGRILEQRTGLDCASCTAKLGTPAPEGSDCVLARCGGGVGF